MVQLALLAALCLSLMLIRPAKMREKTEAVASLEAEKAALLASLQALRVTHGATEKENARLRAEAAAPSGGAPRSAGA